MSSNSIRISAELFARAQAEADVMSRSAAQQVEHWARMGAALEASGLTVEQARELIQRGSLDAGGGVRHHTVQESTLWQDKRRRQRRDLENVAAGHVSAPDLNWFAGGQARSATIAGTSL